MEIKKVTIIISVFVFFLLYLIYTFLLQERIYKVVALNSEINTKNLIYEEKLENYINMEVNKQLLFSLLEENNREVVIIGDLARAVISVSDIMKQNNIVENRFSLSNMARIDHDVFVQPINITGFGKYQDIMRYLNDLNNSDEFFLIDRIRITKENEELFYLNLDVLIVTGDVNGR